MSVELIITGTPQLEAALRRTGGNVTMASVRALFEEAESIMGDSKENYVPVDLAVLKNSGHVQLPKVTNDGIDVSMGYGGAAKDYALAVHEHLSEHSPPSWKAAEKSGNGVHFSPAGHGPKYLERPLLKAARGLARRLAERIKGAIA